MPTSRLTVCLAIFMAWALSCLVVPAAYAQRTTTTVPTPKTVAKAPAATPAKPAATAPVKATTSAPAKTLKLAQLDYPVPPTASAAELLQAADDYAVYADWVNYRAYLQQVVSSHPGTKEAGLALGLLADEYASIGDTNNADACNAKLAGYADAEVQAFAALCRTAFPAHRLHL